MRIIRIIYRVFKFFSVLYAVYRGSKITRIIWLIRTIIRIVKRKPEKFRVPKVMFTYVGANRDEIYRRKGWRKISLQNREQRR